MHVSYAVDKATTVDNTTNQRSRLPTPNASAGGFNLYPVPAACLLYWLAAFCDRPQQHNILCRLYDCLRIPPEHFTWLPLPELG